MKRIIGMLLCFVMMAVSLFSCESVGAMLGETNLDSNVASKHCVCKGKIYIDKYVLDANNKLVLVNDALSSGTNEITIDSLASDGEYVYYLVSDIALTDDGADWDSRILRWDGTEMLDIARWDRPLSGSNNRSMKIHGDYIYFFRENDNGSNFVCRVQRDGGEVETLCENNTDKLYTGIFFIDDTVYVHFGRNIYKTDLNNLSPEKLSDDNLICSGVQRIFLHDNSFYYVRYLDNGINNLYKFSTEEDCETLVLNNIVETSIVFTDNNIYYSHPTPELTGINKTVGVDIDGNIYKYNLNSGKCEIVLENSNYIITQMYNANDYYIFAEAFTKEQYVSIAHGYTTQYMLIPTSGKEAIILDCHT